MFQLFGNVEHFLYLFIIVTFHWIFKQDGFCFKKFPFILLILLFVLSYRILLSKYHLIMQFFVLFGVVWIVLSLVEKLSHSCPFSCLRIWYRLDCSFVYFLVWKSFKTCTFWHPNYFYTFFDYNVRDFYCAKKFLCDWFR